MEKTICELFAGVGGFRLGFDKLRSGWRTVWFSQWEPGARVQWAHDCYLHHFGDCFETNGECHTDADIGIVDKTTIPDHTLLVGGFPCQDYSVANTLSTAKGIEGKKGVLWWQIRDTLIAKKPPFCLLENVDRLLKSPASQRGRDFGIILACFAELGYSVEWRVINAAQYGAAQRRRRTFIFAYRNDTNFGRRAAKLTNEQILRESGMMPQAFPIDELGMIYHKQLPQDLIEVSANFKFSFENAGCMHNWTVTTAPVVENEIPPIVLRDILIPNADEKYYITSDKLADWVYMKGAKRKSRKTAEGHEYIFSEGAIAFPDPWDRPGRTMLTSESTQNRSTHIVSDPWTGKLRTLTPVEAERLQGFDDDWTNTGMPDRMRFFCMGNALVVPMITRMGRILDEIIAQEEKTKTHLEEVMAEHIYQKRELIDKFDAILGKRLEEIDDIGFFKKVRSMKLQKGVVGTFIEQCILKYPPDTKPDPDLLVIDNDVETKTELKTTGMVLRETPETHFEAKEPMSITAVGVYDIADEVFDTSHFWNKLEHMLLVYYHYTEDTPVPPYEYRKFPVKGYEFHEFSEEERAALKRDWEYVHALVKKIVAHHPGEKTKMWKDAVKKEYIDVHGELRPVLSYIDLAPKFPPRFRLKQPIVSSIISKHFGYALEQLPGKYSVITDIDVKCKELTAQYNGKTIGEIADILGLGKLQWNKATAERLIVAMFGGKAAKLNQIEIFQRFGIIAKTITTTATGTRTEDMKLFHIDFQEVTRKEFLGDDGIVRPMQFEDSEFYSYFADHEFLCIMFEEPKNDGTTHSLLQNRFIGFKRLVFSDKFIDESVRKLWLDTRAKILNGSLVDVRKTKKDGEYVLLKNSEISSAPNFMKAKDNVVFIRGGGIDSSSKHKTETVNGIKMLPQHVWIRGTAIVEELKNTPQL